MGTNKPKFQQVSEFHPWISILIYVWTSVSPPTQKIEIRKVAPTWPKTAEPKIINLYINSKVK